MLNSYYLYMHFIATKVYGWMTGSFMDDHNYWMENKKKVIYLMTVKWL